MKAVRLDPIKHRDLLEYIDNYRDDKGKPNHSEAIRILMTAGLRVVRGEGGGSVNGVDVETLTQRVFDQVMNALGTSEAFTKVNGLGSGDRAEPKRTVRVQRETVAQPVQIPSSKTDDPSIGTTSSSVNPILANILGNANR